jgi:hypothetical protein
VTQQQTEPGKWMVDLTLRALPTSYQGYEFRSRTEARWAVFLDALSIRWEYERQGFIVGGIRYLPDFYLPELERYLEIKGSHPTPFEVEKCRWLAEGTGREVLLAIGEPHPPQESGDSLLFFDIDGTQDHSYWFTVCTDCEYVDATFHGRAARLRCRCIVARQPDEDKVHNFGCERLLAAYQSSRTAFTGAKWRP